MEYRVVGRYKCTTAKELMSWCHNRYLTRRIALGGSMKILVAVIGLLVIGLGLGCSSGLTEDDVVRLIETHTAVTPVLASPTPIPTSIPTPVLASPTPIPTSTPTPALASPTPIPTSKPTPVLVSPTPVPTPFLTPPPGVLKYYVRGDKVTLYWNNDPPAISHSVECGVTDSEWSWSIYYLPSSGIPGPTKYLEIELAQCSTEDEMKACSSVGCEFWFRHRSKRSDGWSAWSRVEFKFSQE